MIEDIIIKYKDIIKIKRSKWLKASVCFVIVFTILFVVLTIKEFFLLDSVLFSYILLFIGGTILFIIKNHSSMKKVIKRDLKIDLEGHWWNSTKNNHLIDKKHYIIFKEWLKKHELYSPENIDPIINNLERSKKNKNYVIPTISAGLALYLFPVWDKYLDLLFNNHVQIGIERVVFEPIFLVLVLGIMLTVIRSMFREVVQYIFNRDQKIIDKVISLLLDLQLENNTDK